jgi:hypothetical protein
MVQRSALVRLDMRKRDVTQLLDRDDARDRFAHERKHLAQPGVEQKRRVVDNQILVEGEAAWDEVGRDRGADAVYSVGDLVDVGAGLFVGYCHGASPIVRASPDGPQLPFISHLA